MRITTTAAACPRGWIVTVPDHGLLLAAHLFDIGDLVRNHLDPQRTEPPIGVIVNVISEPTHHAYSS